MPLTTLEVVKDYLNVTGTADDARIERFRESTEQFIKERYGRDWDLTGPQVDRFYNKQEGSIVYLRDEFPSVAKVEVWYDSSSSSDLGRVLKEYDDFNVLDEGKVQLILRRYGNLGGIRGSHLIGTRSVYQRIQVSYVASGIVPIDVEEAVSRSVASTFISRIQSNRNVKSERIGDYSYASGDDSNLHIIIPEAADKILKRHKGQVLKGVYL